MVNLIKSNISNKKYIYQFVPETLMYLTESKYIIYNDRKLKTDYLIDIIHKFITKYQYLKKKRIKLYSIILRKIYGKYYNYYFNYLKEKNILKISKEYMVDIKCREYEINKDILNNKLIRYNNYDKILIKKWKDRFLEYEINNATYNKIDDDFVLKRICNSLLKIEIDGTEAKEYIRNLYKNNEISYDSYICNIMNIDSIENEDLFYNKDKYGRFHTNFTTLKKEIRNNFLKIDGYDIVELDIKNSQPVFLMQLLKDYNFHINYKEEYEKYYNILKYDSIYDIFGTKLEVSKKEAKRLFYKVLFGKNNFNMKYNKIFFELFPNIYNFVISFKLNNKKDGNKDYYKILSTELQQRESNLIFNNICKVIYRKYPNIDLFTVHDSIFFPKHYEKEVKIIFTEYVNTLFRRCV